MTFPPSSGECGLEEELPGVMDGWVLAKDKVQAKLVAYSEFVFLTFSSLAFCCQLVSFYHLTRGQVDGFEIDDLSPVAEGRHA